MKTFTEFINYAHRKGIYMGPNFLGIDRCVFEDKLINFFGIDKQGLTDLLCNINIRSLQNSSNWQGAILMSLEVLRDNDGKGINTNKVLKSWLPNLKENIELADLVLFYFIIDEMKNEWIDECKRLAIMTENESLLESLIYKLEGKIGDDEKLKEVIDRNLTDSEKIKKAFWSKISPREKER